MSREFELALDLFPTAEEYVDGALTFAVSISPLLAASVEHTEHVLERLQDEHPGHVVSFAMGIPPNTLRSKITIVE